jgi:hypothetical protein
MEGFDMSINELFDIIAECSNTNDARDCLKCDDDSININIPDLIRKLSLFESDSELYQSLVDCCFGGLANKLGSYLSYADRLSIEIDLDQDDNCLAQICARRGFISCLKILKEYGADMKNKDILGVAALFNQKDVVLYLINECESDPRELLSTASYNNWPEIKTIFDNHIKAKY